MNLHVIWTIKQNINEKLRLFRPPRCLPLNSKTHVTLYWGVLWKNKGWFSSPLLVKFLHLFIYLFILFLFFSFSAAPTAYGSSQPGMEFKPGYATAGSLTYCATAGTPLHISKESNAPAANPRQKVVGWHVPVCVCVCVCVCVGTHKGRGLVVMPTFWGDIIPIEKERLELALRKRALLEPIGTVAFQELHWLEYHMQGLNEWTSPGYQNWAEGYVLQPVPSAVELRMEFDLHTNRNGAREVLPTLSVVKYQVQVALAF